MLLRHRAESGLVNVVVRTAVNVADVTQIHKLLHGEENVVCADAGNAGVEIRPEHAGREVIWPIAIRGSTYKQLTRPSTLNKARCTGEKAEEQIRGQARISVLSDQAPVRLCQSELSGVAQEHHASDYLVQSIRTVDGTSTVADQGG
ncbi:hypothetical protein D3C76_496350 [compost metagenome]